MFYFYTLCGFSENENKKLQYLLMNVSIIVMEMVLYVQNILLLQFKCCMQYGQRRSQHMSSLNDSMEEIRLCNEKIQKRIHISIVD